MSPQTDGTSELGEVPKIHRARGYQLEMLEESLKRNVIVAMDTGSGKTYVAVLRIMAELDRCVSDKLVWFLAPTVALCQQQHDTISLQLPAVRTRLFTGADNVDRWSEQRIWDSALADMQVIISTHAVLADALGHGFVRITRLSLLIFDEAHHCARKHPANRIMQDFYHPALKKFGRSAVPRILGLTASPIMRSKPSELELVFTFSHPVLLITEPRIIEANLDSISRTPRIQRQEMLQYVHRPVLRKLDYHALDDETFTFYSRALQNLISVSLRMDIRKDPHVLRLLSNKTSPEILEKIFSTRKTYCREQMRKFRETAKHICVELGQWAADYFILESIKRLERAVNAGAEACFGWENDEKVYLLQELTQVAPREVETYFSVDESLKFSPKVERLISFLIAEDRPDFSGLLFVRQRATVSVLTTLLSTHPETKDRFQCAPFVGTSNSASKKHSICELLDVRQQTDTLTHFREGQKNLIIATDVLEEGIDIPVCHLVICFDPPANLKSFVQRRGRARQMESTFAIMAADNDPLFSFARWQNLEEDMIRTYQDDARQLKEISALESTSEDVLYKIEIESTGAVLSAETAIAHLYHFCALLPQQPYVDLRPAFTFTRVARNDLIVGTVNLPICLIPSVRRITGRGSWKTERAAMKDASFQACVDLHSAGLLNDHFLPLKNERPTEMEEIEELSRIIEISEQYDPWVDVAERWSLPKLHQTMVTVTKNNGNGEDEVSVRVTTPIAISSPGPFILYWDRNTIFTVRFGMSRPVSVMTPDNLELMREIAHTMIRSTSSNSKPDDRKDFVVLFCPDVKVDHFATWLTANRGTRLALENYHSDHDKLPHGLVRSSLTYGTRYIFKRWCTPSNGAPEEIAVECSPLLRRRNFLLPGNLSGRSIDKSDHEDDSSAQVRSIPASACTIDLLPFEQARVSLFIPACLQHMEVLMVANQLRKTVLKDVPFKKINHVITAISASSAQWVVNYQRFEFLGDSLLKFVISNQLFADHKNWHEGYLSQNRDSLVSNSRLARAALDIGLDPFILTKSFATRGWTVPLISEVKKRAAGRRYISSKVLADVVEALIGAAFVDGGLSEARAWIHTFFPAVSIQPPCFRSIVNDISHNAAQGSLIGKKGESLIGYKFVHKALLTEAFTHGSCERDAVTQSYQRLEFLGDAILDMVVVSQLVEINKDLTHGEMSLIKAAVVNADFLAFLCMEFALKTSAIRIQQTATGKFGETQETKQIELWMFMRHHSQEISRSQVKCQERHQQLRQEISGCLKRGTYHPWTMLAQLNADKFYSDLVESVLGAIFVDSEGDLADCRRFAERIGILPYLRRVVVKGVDVIHPITALDRLKGSEQIEYVVTSQETGHGRYRCLVKICGVEIVAVGGCLGRDEAMTRAADAVLKMTSALTTRSRGGNTDGCLV